MENQKTIERIFSIGELKSMIKAIKGNNPIYENKRIPKQACGVFLIGEVYTLKHRHIGIQEYNHVKFYNKG